MANPATSFAYVFAANAARGLPLVGPHPSRPASDDEQRWRLDAEAEERGTAEDINNRKPRAGRRPRPDRP
jgi:hypothetical protein